MKGIDDMSITKIGEELIRPKSRLEGSLAVNAAEREIARNDPDYVSNEIRRTLLGGATGALTGAAIAGRGLRTPAVIAGSGLGLGIGGNIGRKQKLKEEGVYTRFNDLDARFTPEAYEKYIGDK